MAKFSKINSFFRKAFYKNLFATNTTTCIVLLGVGDCLTQYVEKKSESITAGGVETISTTTSSIVSSAAAFKSSDVQMNLVSTQSTFNVDWTRNSKMLALGTIIGPIQHLWYSFLDKKFPKKTKSIIFKKMILDQITFAPILNIVLIAGLHFMDGEKLSTLKAPFKEKFLTLYTYDCMLWMPAQFVNFSLISPKNRVLYVNMVTLVWNTISSFVIFNDAPTIHSTFE